MQGILTGNLDELQQLALVTIIRLDAEKEAERDFLYFKMMAVTAHPEKAPDILGIRDEPDFKPEEWEEILPGEEFEYVPVFEREESQQVLRDLQLLGFSLN